MTRPGKVVRTAVAIIIALLFLLPLWWVTIGAFRPEDEIFRFLSPLTIETLLPRHIIVSNVIEVWQSDFSRAIFNSIFVTAITVVVGLTVCSLAAFALAVIDFPGRGAVFTIMVVSFLIPFDAIALPLYNIMRGFQLQNTYIGLVLPGIGNGLTVFLLRQFFLGLPKELREAATVDGLGWFGIFWRIYLPLSGNALISAGLILFVFQWQAYLWPLLIAPAPDYKVAAVSIAQFPTSFEVRYGLIFAGAFFISVIPMLVLLGFQRYLAASVASTGSKE
jgi:ABC-type glycerol-3-phosphate transport system permease component